MLRTFLRAPPYALQNAVLDLEFYKILEAHHTVKDHLDAGSELDITFITQLDAKKLCEDSRNSPAPRDS